MAGHSKWANIKHKKERADNKKGKIFSQIAKEIIVAVKEGGSDPKANIRLKGILQKAKKENVPSEIIQRNIKKGSDVNQLNYFHLTYELYGYGGVGILVDIITDNKNRIASDMRIATNKKGGAVASPGSVAYNFVRQGVIYIIKDEIDVDTLFMKSVESGALDMKEEENGFVVYTPPDDLYQVKDSLNLEESLIEEIQIEWIPKIFSSTTREEREKNEQLIDYIENLEDVKGVFDNMEIVQDP